MRMSNEKKKEFNPTLCMLYKMKNGSWSLPLGSKEYDAFMNHIEQGGRIVVKENQYRKDNKSPHFFLEIIPAAKVKEMDAAREAQKSNSSDSI
jgi:hypothetical protein